jgi:hypothetical protein
MARKLLVLSGLASVVVAITTYAVPVVVAGMTSGPDRAPVAAPAAMANGNSATGPDKADPHGTTAVDVVGTPNNQVGKVQAPPPGGWPVPSQRSYTITASCQPHAAAIRAGAAAWQGLTEGGGTPIECRNTYITDCGGGSNVVGCNWGAGQRIALYMGGVTDDALLAAHEFGHDWYGHSSFQCAGWDSPANVMAPTICN